MRLVVARDAGLDEATIANISSFRPQEPTTFSPRHRSAMLLADAMMTQPGAIEAALVTELHAHFTDAELLELTLDVMKWNYQKVSVALGIDDEMPPELSDLVWDENGNWLRPAT